VLIHTSTGFVISWIRPIYIYMHNLHVAIDKEDCGQIAVNTTSVIRALDPNQGACEQTPEVMFLGWPGR
jgi:hypothetical protein